MRKHRHKSKIDSKTRQHLGWSCIMDRALSVPASDSMCKRMHSRFQDGDLRVWDELGFRIDSNRQACPPCEGNFVRGSSNVRRQKCSWMVLIPAVQSLASI